MADPSDRAAQACLLVYDGQCRLVSQPKGALERLGTHADATPIRRFRIRVKRPPSRPWGELSAGRPNVAFMVSPNGEIAVGSMHFWPSCQASRVGGSLSALELPLVKPFGYLLYWFVARYRYSIFGKVPLAGVSRIRYAKSKKPLTSKGAFRSRYDPLVSLVSVHFCQHPPSFEGFYPHSGNLRYGASMRTHHKRGEPAHDDHPVAV